MQGWIIQECLAPVISENFSWAFQLPCTWIWLIPAEKISLVLWRPDGVGGAPAFIVLMLRPRSLPWNTYL